MGGPGIDELLPLLRERFGISALHPLQRLAIANVLAAAAPPGASSREGKGPGRSSEDGAREEGEAEEEALPRQLVILPTGAGKSLCFQGPALLLGGPTLVVYPLLALIEDQRRRLKAAGIPAAVFRGGQSREERATLLAGLRCGNLPLALATPEVLGGRGLLAALTDLRIAHLAIDEAHCVVEWGESFRPSYLELGRLAEILKPRMLSAFTATAGPELRGELARRLFGPEPYALVEGSPDRPNIGWSVLPTLSRSASLFRLLRELPRPLIVFSSSRRGVEALAASIHSRRPDLELRFYHAGLEAEEKRRVEAWFLASEEGILTATCAYGLGVDKRNIRSVVHWRLPPGVEAYLQEAGRAGRDGLPARAVLLLGPDEEGGGHRQEGRPRGGREGRREGSRAGLLAWARSAEGCRRASLLALLGSRLEGSCGGCDRCEGRAPEQEEGRASLLGLLGREGRRWTRAELIRLLEEAGGRGSLGLGEDSPLPPLPELRGWSGAELAEALGSLLERGEIRERRGFLWKGRLELTPRPRPGPEEGRGDGRDRSSGVGDGRGCRHSGEGPRRRGRRRGWRGPANRGGP